MLTAGRWPRSLLLLLLLLSACGYRPARPPFDAVAVAPIAAEAPVPEVAACLTRELRRGLAARGVRVGRGARLRLEGEVVAAGAEPGGLAFESRPVATDQDLVLVVRVRLVDRRRGPVWGPTNLRLRRRAALGPSALHSIEAAREGWLRACREAADEIILELSLLDRDSM